jgi:hypothetical protein
MQAFVVVLHIREIVPVQEFGAHYVIVGGPDREYIGTFFCVDDCVDVRSGDTNSCIYSYG